MSLREPSHILIVDDDDRIRDLTKRFLTMKGFRVTGAPDAAAASRLMENMAFDLAVLDIMMPGETGLELLERIRSGPSRATPVMLLTARGATRDRIEGLLPIGEQSGHIADMEPPPRILQRMPGTVTQRPLIPLDDGGYQFGDGHLRRRCHRPQRRRQGKAHAQATDQHAGVGDRPEVGATQLRQGLFRAVHAAVHQLAADTRKADGELVSAPRQLELAAAARDLSRIQYCPGRHRDPQ